MALAEFVNLAKREMWFKVVSRRVRLKIRWIKTNKLLEIYIFKVFLKC
jgi:hypothetical protein